jgi:sulfur carrier protein
MKSAEAAITVNGRKELICVPCTVAHVLDQAGLKPTQVVVERNGSVLPRLLLAETLLENGDRLEVIVPVAGG